MFCSKCGAQLPEGTNFCTRCGTSTQTTGGGTTGTSQSGTYTPPVYTRPTENPYVAYRPEPQQPAFPMKWFKFTIYFQLFANAVLNLFNAFSSLLGLSYGTYAEDVYFAYPGLHSLDIIMGILYLLLAAFAIFTRFQLAGFKKRGPTLLYVFLAANLVLLLFYVVAASVVTATNLVSVTIVSNTVTMVVLLVCDYIYFTKRQELFVK